MTPRCLLLVVLAWPLVAYAQPKPEDDVGACPFGMGPGMMGPGMMGDDWMGPGMMGNALDLTDSQRARIGEIQGDVARPMWELGQKLAEQRAKLSEAYAADPVDPDRVRELSGNIGRLQQQVMELRVTAHNRVMKVLTKDQREQLSNMRRGRWGHGMRGPGMRNRPR